MLALTMNENLHKMFIPKRENKTIILNIFSLLFISISEEKTIRLLIINKNCGFEDVKKNISTGDDIMLKSKNFEIYFFRHF